MSEESLELKIKELKEL